MALDLSNILDNVTDSAEPIGRKPGAGRPRQDNPFGPVILSSWDGGAEDSNVGSTKVLTIENDKDRSEKSGEPHNIATIKGLLRRAADDAGLGVKIVVTETNAAGKAVAEGKTGTHSTVRFAAKEKTLRTRKTENTDDAFRVIAEPPSY